MLGKDQLGYIVGVEYDRSDVVVVKQVGDRPVARAVGVVCVTKPEVADPERFARESENVIEDRCRPGKGVGVHQLEYRSAQQLLRVEAEQACDPGRGLDDPAGTVGE